MKFVEEDDILHIIYNRKEQLPASILEICDQYEGKIPQRIGTNFPMDFVKKMIPSHPLLKYNAKYVIAYQKGDIVTKKHEMCHAAFYLDPDYRKKIETMWTSFSKTYQKKVYQMLQKMKYPNNPQILLDEFQAYYFTEKSNFFGKES